MRRATRDGCRVRHDVIMMIQPGRGFHCDRWPPSIRTGSPLGEPYGDNSTRVYVRDPGGRLNDPEVTAGFEPDAELPPQAQRSTYRIDGADLWTVPDDPYLYLRYDDRTERWPFDPSPEGCA